MKEKGKQKGGETANQLIGLKIFRKIEIAHQLNHSLPLVLLCRSSRRSCSRQCALLRTADESKEKQDLGFVDQ